MLAIGDFFRKHIWGREFTTPAAPEKQDVDQSPAASSQEDMFVL